MMNTTKKKQYLKNIDIATKGTGNLFLFAGDQRIEHLNRDVAGKGISKDDQDPKHFFNIASKAKIGVFATQLGYLARYGPDFPNVNYIVKLNSKTNLSKEEPISTALYDVEQVVEFRRNTGLKILGVGYTLYLGSIHEHIMLREAAQIIYKAHKEGLFVVLWIYPRGKAVKDEKSVDIITGAAGVGMALNADFIKVNCPKDFKKPIAAAGSAKVIFAGGGSENPKKFLQLLKKQIDAGAGGNATGRNVHQKDLKSAIKFCNAIYAISVEKKSLEKAYKILK